MALFADGPPSSIEDLTGYDSQLRNVASTEGIDVTRKLALAQEELGLELAAQLARTSNDPGAGLRNVVTTPALKIWHAYRTLELVYGDAYNSQLNDRYAGKRDQFGQMAKWAQEKLFQTGLGVTLDPVPRAKAPSVRSSPGALADGAYYVTAAWLNGAGEEGLAAPATLFQVLRSTLQVGVEGVPATVRGWNVYVGRGPEEMTLQNASAISTTDQWVQPNVLLTNGPRPGDGQMAAYVRPAPRVLRRG